MASNVRRVSVAENMKISPQKPRAAFGVRHVQAALLTLGFLCCYSMRVCLSVAIVAMNDEKSPEHFDWGEQTQNLILSSFFWGYVVSHIPAGVVVQLWGGQKLLGAAIGLCAISTIAIPMAARYGGIYVVVGCRIFAGLCQGFVPPILHSLLAKWVPLQERGRFTTFVYSGGWIGNVIALQSSGLLSASSLGWPGCFYFWGVIGLIWSINWHFFGRESPAEHPGITLDEKQYIESSLGVVETTEPMSTPWKSILTSIPVWALLVAQCTQAWGFWLLLSKIPSYMKSVLQYDIQNNGLMSSLPYLTAWLLSFPVSFLSDWAIRTNKVTTRTSRMICNTFGEVFPAICLLGLGYVGADQSPFAVSILILAVAGNIAIYCGHHANHMDLSPNFAGPLMGFTNAAANVCSILAPLVHGVMVTEPSNLSQWRSLFFLTAGMYIIGALAFLLFGTAKVQPWNDPLSRKNSRHYGFPDGPHIPEVIRESSKEGKEEKIER